MEGKILNTGIKFFEEINQPEILAAAQKLAAEGVEFECSFYTVLFSKDGVGLGKAILPSSTLSMMKGTLKEEVVSLCAKMLSVRMLEVGVKIGVDLNLQGLPETDNHDKLWTALKKEALSADYSGVPPPPTGVFEGVMSNFQNLPKAKKFKIKEPSTDSTEVISLVTATNTLQRVKGTSDSSVYVAVGISDLANLAVRFKGNAASFRIEQKPLKGSSVIEPALMEMGFSKVNGGHWSMHFDCSTPLLQARTLGSIISGLTSLGVPFDQSELNITHIKEKL